MLTEPATAPRSLEKIEQLSETSDYPMGGLSSRKSSVDSRSGGQLTRVGFIAVVTVCSLAVLVALLLFAHTMVRRHDRLSGYLPGVMGGKNSRKPSERPLVPPVSPANTGGVSRNDSLDEKQNRGTPSTCSPTSPPPYQETLDQDGKQVDMDILNLSQGPQLQL